MATDIMMLLVGPQETYPKSMAPPANMTSSTWVTGFGVEESQLVPSSGPTDVIMVEPWMLWGETSQYVA